MERPDKTMYFLDIALAVAKRSTCLRRKFGAVIVKDNTIVGTGYNGNARGVVNCSELGCIKNIMQSTTRNGIRLLPRSPRRRKRHHKQQQSRPNRRHTIHSRSKPRRQYTMALPCQRCQRKIINSQIKQVILLRDDGKPMTISITRIHQRRHRLVHTTHQRSQEKS